VVDIIPIFADTSCDEAFISNCNGSFFTLGITPYGSLDHGFPQAYYTTFGRRPINGEAQVYDALTIIALGAYYQMVSPDKCIVDGMEVSYDQDPHGAGLTDYMRAVVSREGISTGWDERSLISAFWYIGQDDYFSLYGATGNLYFDQRTHTKVLNTTYMLWVPKRQDNGQCELVPAIYLSTNGTSSQASTTSIWEQEKRWYDDNFVSEDTPELPDVTDHWAVVISPSTTWANYRHQADALAMYQQLLFSGYDDDHIVLIVEDNLYNDPHNVFPDKIFVNRYGDDEDEDFNVHYNVNVDYHFSQLTPDDIADIMTGRQSDRLPHVIHSTSTSNVFFFWSGHGGSREGPLWGNEDSKEYFGKQRIHDIVEQMNRSKQYRRLLFAIETCYSGHWGEAIQGMPNTLAITAANTREMSDADVYDQTLGVFLSNAFARTFRDQVFNNNNVSIYELYHELVRTTIGSHVSLYNQDLYGSVYTNTLADFFPQ
jgi:glycosylphosphatidylinositol transamidase (GPIT) subunit GPI8